MKKDIIRSIIIVGLIVTLTISSTYAFMNLNTDNNSTTGNGGCFQVSYTGTAVTNIEIEAGGNYTDSGASAHPIVKLSKNSSCKIYTEASIYLTVDSTSQIPLAQSEVVNEPTAINAFKYKVMKGSTEVSNGTLLKGNNTGTYDILLATVPLTDTQTTYDIYLWLDMNLSLGAYHEKSFSGKIYAKSDQSSTLAS